MTEPDISADIQHKIDACGASDIAVGIPSFNNAATIGYVIGAVRQGLREFFPSARSVILNLDGGSKDGSVGQALRAVPDASALLQASYRPQPIQELSTTYSGVPGKGNAFRLILQIARALGAKACAVIDPDLQSITPDWIRLLVQPVFDGECDFVAPYYLRQKFDGAITSAVVYPMTRALYGRSVRHPIGGEFCLSRALCDHYLKQDVWQSDVIRFGIDIWAATQAICGGFRTAQVFLGAKVHDSNAPAPDLSSMLTQVLGTIFAEMEKNVTVWQRVRGSEALPVFGKQEAVDSEPVKVDVRNMIDAYDLGCKNLFEVWSLVMPPATLLELKKLSRRANGDFLFPDALWVRVVYDFAVAYHTRRMSRDHLLSALTPLYLGWVASFMLQMQSADLAMVEARIEGLCLCYEAEKPYLISRWRWPDRFSP